MQQRHMEAINSFVKPAHTPLRPSSVLPPDCRRGIDAVQLPGKGNSMPINVEIKARVSAPLRMPETRGKASGEMFSSPCRRVTPSPCQLLCTDAFTLVRDQGHHRFGHLGFAP